MFKRLLLLIVLLTTAGYAPETPRCEGGTTTPPDANGYCQMGLLIPGLVSERTYNTPPPQHFTTRALYQAEGVMEATARLNGFDGTEDYIALMPPMTRGWHVFLRRNPAEVWRGVRVVDVVKREDYYMSSILMHSGVELSWTLATEWGVQGLTNAQGDRYLWGLELCIANERPDDFCTGEAVDYEAWLRSILTFAPRN